MQADAALDQTTTHLPTEAQQDAALFREVLLDITEAARDFAKLLLRTAEARVIGRPSPPFPAAIAAL